MRKEKTPINMSKCAYTFDFLIVLLYAQEMSALSFAVIL